MVFSSVIFIFIFLPCVIFAYYICPKRYLFLRNWILLAFSLAFYFYGEPKYVLVMIASIVINYIFGLLVDWEQSKNKSGKWVVVASVVANLSVLFYFKYLLFFAENVNSIFGSSFIIPNIVMPIGVSFFTFQAMSYVFDVYYKATKVQKNFLDLALFIALFPPLIAGPIIRYDSIAAELKSRVSNFENFSQGVTRFVYGLSKKLILANAMGQVADNIFEMSPGQAGFGLVWIGAIAYTFQIYYDFSGYSDMAIGVGKMFGFNFLENFKFPYISKSITEFWRRWHISLGSWFRDYVYIPMGGNRVKNYKHIINILIVWLLTGFWHGAAWNFVVWGLYFGVVLIIEKHFLKSFFKKAWTPILHIYSLLLIVIGWVIFRSPDMAYATEYVLQMFNVTTINVNSGQVYYYLIQYKAEWIFAVLFSLPVGVLATKLFEKVSGSKLGFAALSGVKLCYVFLLFGISTLYLINSTFNPFIYFRF